MTSVFCMGRFHSPKSNKKQIKQHYMKKNPEETKRKKYLTSTKSSIPFLYQRKPKIKTTQSYTLSYSNHRNKLNYFVFTNIYKFAQIVPNNIFYSICAQLHIDVGLTLSTDQWKWYYMTVLITKQSQNKCNISIQLSVFYYYSLIS